MGSTALRPLPPDDAPVWAGRQRRTPASAHRGRGRPASGGGTCYFCRYLSDNRRHADPYHRTMADVAMVRDGGRLRHVICGLLLDEQRVMTLPPPRSLPGGGVRLVHSAPLQQRRSRTRCGGRCAKAAFVRLDRSRYQTGSMPSPRSGGFESSWLPTRKLWLRYRQERKHGPPGPLQFGIPLLLPRSAPAGVARRGHGTNLPGVPPAAWDHPSAGDGTTRGSPAAVSLRVHSPSVGSAAQVVIGRS